MTGPLSLCMALFYVGQLAAPSQTPEEETKSALQARRLELFQHEAADYRIFRDAEHAVELKFRDEPVFLWTNPTRYHGQEGATHGAVFAWTHRGCAEVIGTIFVHPEKGRLVVSHEFHSLSPVVLEPVRTSGSANRWSPRGHLPRLVVEGVDPPAPSPSARLVQLRSIARRFTAHSVTLRGERWDLRLLPQPAYRYQSDNLELIDGAVFIFASSAGTDPEVILVVEAAKMADEAQWQYGVARFSDANLYIEYDAKQVWTSVRGGENTHDHNPSYTFRYYRDKVVDALSDGEGEETDRKQRSRQAEGE
ncbi:MAG TPA: hypothetical protein VMV10_01015 [Pirellulales bacterium]|nr:hypothetical protein [Pirellulales bacterium]